MIQLHLKASDGRKHSYEAGPPKILENPEIAKIWKTVQTPSLLLKAHFKQEYFLDFLKSQVETFQVCAFLFISNWN